MRGATGDFYEESLYTTMVVKWKSMKAYVLLLNCLAFVLLFHLIAYSNAHAGDSIEAAGDILTYTLPAAAAGLSIGLKDGNGTLQLAETMALTMSAANALKYTTNETRPNGERYSFPSAHSAASFASAEFIRKRYGWEYGFPCYIMAGLVAYSRVEARQHYVHDVIAGAVIGVASSYLLTKPYKGWHIEPQADLEGRYGVRLFRVW